MKPTPEAVAFRARIDAEGPDWPAELKDAATWLHCELENVPRNGWHEAGGPRHLAECLERFAQLYAAWRSA